MSTLKIAKEIFAKAISFTEDSMVVFLDDGRSIAVPLAWYPRLNSGTAKEREHYELIGDGEGIHWPDLDEDISVEGVIAGRGSVESAKSLERWLSARDSSQ